MKLTFVLLITTFLQITFARDSFSQKISLSKDNTSLVEVFKEIRKQSGYDFLYKMSLMREAKSITIHVKDVPLKRVLEICFADQPFTYSVENKTIIVNPRTNSAIIDEPKPQIIIKGRVTDAKGVALIGVSVKLKGTTIGTTTDLEGNYSLSAPEEGILVFSYIGFISQEIRINGNTSINVELQEDNANLGEVVVTALGISREKKSLAYAVTEFGGDALSKAREINLGNALAGRVAGVNATSTATGPGGSSRVIIRGNGSLSGDNQPLYVINGIPINNSNQGSAGTYGGIDSGDGLSSINPDDIETISVLKGGTAAALYGSRAANGVILITTKLGKAQQGIGVEFTSTYTLEKALTFSDWQYGYGSGSRGLKPSTKGEAIVNGRTSWGAKLDGTMVIQPDGMERTYSAQQNNIKNFYDDGATFSNTIALNGGNQNANFRFSASNIDNNGIVPNSSINRKTFNLSTNALLGKKLSFEGRIQYNIEENENRPSVADFTKNPNASVQLIGTNIDVRTLAPGYDSRGYETEWSDYVYVANPYFAVNKVKNSDERRRVMGSFSAKYDITEFLYARTRFGIDQFNIEGSNLTPTGILYNTRGSMFESRNNTFETNIEGILGFNKVIGDFSVSLLAGGNQMYNRIRSGRLNSGNFNVPFNYFISNGSSQTFTSNFQESAINSLFASADIGFNYYLYLTLTGRQDWFSTLAKESNSLFYPSVGLSFVFSDAWKSKPSWLSYGKLRSSWAQVGGGAPNPYGIDLVFVAQSVPHLGQPLMNINGSTIPNSLKPYTSTTVEAGLETRLFNNRVGVDLTVYERTTSNDIVSASTPQSSSYTAVALNVGEMRNRGIEVLISGTPVNKALKWDISLNGAFNDNKVLKIVDGLTTLQLPGATTRTLNGGVFHYEGSPFGMIAGNTFKTDGSGNVVYNNANGIPIQSSIVPLGKGVPPLTLGLSNNFQFKNFSLGVLVDGKFGGQLYSATNAYATYYGLDKRTSANNVRESGVLVKGVDQNGAPYSNTISAQDYYQGIAFAITDQFVTDADFLKLRQLTLGYTLPTSVISKTPFQAVNLSLVSRNLLLLYSTTKNVDPESTYNNSNAQGLENLGVPTTRSLGLNLSVRF